MRRTGKDFSRTGKDCKRFSVSVGARQALNMTGGVLRVVCFNLTAGDTPFQQPIKELTETFSVSEIRTARFYIADAFSRDSFRGDELPIAAPSEHQVSPPAMEGTGGDEGR